MRDLTLVKILELVSWHIGSVGRCSGSRRKLLFIDDHATHCARVMALPLRLLNGDVASVRAEQRVRLFALFDVLLLYKQLGELRAIYNPPYLTPIIG